MPVPPEVMGVATLALTQSISSFHTFLPPLVDIRKSSPGDRTAVADVRLGEIASAGLAIGIGIIFTSMTGNSTPFFVASIAALGLISIYEYALRSEP